MRNRLIAPLLLLILGAPSLQDPADPQAALQSIDARRIRAHLQFLSHDRLEGRAPGTDGGELAALYIASQLEAAGLRSIRGSYYQQVPLVGATPSPESALLAFRGPAGEHKAEQHVDAVIWTGSAQERVDLSTELVFVGYGVTAPEYQWDDYGDRDLEGKILLILVNDPPAPPDEPDLFRGREMTYYGRWTYKFEEAARRGAAGALLVHSTESAGYPWDVVVSSWTGERVSLADDPQPQLQIKGWVTRGFANRILTSGDLSLEELFVTASRRDFRPVSTGITATVALEASVRRFEAPNVVGLVPGADPDRRAETVLFMAHWDHLGIGPAVDGDSIYNGAYDNASGVSALITLAHAFGSMDPAPPRSIMFLATTAEEAGLLGATYYVDNPLRPLGNTIAAINLDGVNLWGETDDVIAVGGDRSTLGQVVAVHADSMDMELVPERSPELGLFFRSDHYPFAAAGVPAIKLEHGIRFRNRPDDWGIRTLQRYNAEHYHRPTDRYDPAFDLSGAVQQTRLAYRIGLALARTGAPPVWIEGYEPAR